MSDLSTTDQPSVTAVFGLPTWLPRHDAGRTLDQLEGLWRACHGQAPSSLRFDVELHRKRFFDPVSQGKRLREALSTITPDAPVSGLSPLHTIAVDDRRTLITPEGRVAIELLARALDSEAATVAPPTGLADRWERELLGLYREWGRHRLNSVVNLLGGGDKPLQYPAIGGTLTLLVNRSDAPERAIKRFPPGTSRDVIDSAFRSCAHAFAQELAPSSKRSPEKERLISGWTLHEVTRRMPDGLRISDEGGVYVVGERRNELISLLGAELRRRESIERTLLEDAFDALVREFARRAQELAGFGLLFERPAETARLRQLLLDAWAAAPPPA